MNKPISIHDMKSRQSRAISMLSSLGNADPRVIASAMKSMLKRYLRNHGTTSKYRMPHQGAKECARRARQRRNGTHGVDSWRYNERKQAERNLRNQLWRVSRT